MSEQINKIIDHTLLAPDATEDQIEKLCQQALEFEFATVCVNPTHLPLAVRLCQNSKVKVCSVIGFPLGASIIETKVKETEMAIMAGADEIDMVLNIGALKDQKVDFLTEEIAAVVKAANGKVVKVIIETCLLNDDQKIMACDVIERACAHYIKTSTGFSKSGAALADIILFKKHLKKDTKIKASGGIRDLETALEFIKAGADRIGTSSGPLICQA